MDFVNFSVILKSKRHNVSENGPVSIAFVRNKDTDQRWKQNLLQTGKSKESAIFWDVTPCGSCKNQRFGGT
jgi:hypothetical protein